MILVFSSSTSPESGIGMSSSSLPCSEQDHSESLAAPSCDVIDGDDEEEEVEEVVGLAHPLREVSHHLLAALHQVPEQQAVEAFISELGSNSIRLFVTQTKKS